MYILSETCCFTGHRVIPPSLRPQLEKRLENEIVNLINQGVKYFGAGGAIGFDTLSALSVISLRRSYPHIKLILVLPFCGQSDKWSTHDKKIYSYILSMADKVVYISDKYTKDCFHRRNMHLVENSLYCICYLSKNYGGTAFTASLAQKLKRKVINLAESEQ